jgi:hypothetical protein
MKMAKKFRGRACHTVLALATCLALGDRANGQPDAPSDEWPGMWESPDTGWAMATPPGEFSLGLGYANLSIGGSDSVLESLDALRWDASLSYAPFADLPQLRVGAGFGVAMVFDDSEFAFISSGGAIFIGSADIPLFTLEPEFRVSWQQFFGPDENFYVEPGIGVGGVFANINIDSEDTASGESFDEWESSVSARVFLNVGFLAEGGFAGVQASYMWAESLDFAENAQGEVQEFYIGIFGALRF